MTKTKGKVKAISGPNEFNGVLQIGFVLEGSDQWHNISGEESFLKEILEKFIKKGNEIDFDEDAKKNITDLKLIKEAEKSEGKSGGKKSNHIVRIQGKDFMTYEGVLNKLHEKSNGNFSMVILESGKSEDMKRAWCKVRLTVGENLFDGIGSSTPENTGSVTDHPLELANTRAKGRAIRDYLNIGQVMAEELKETK